MRSHMFVKFGIRLFLPETYNLYQREAIYLLNLQHGFSFGSALKLHKNQKSYIHEIRKNAFSQNAHLKGNTFSHCVLPLKNIQFHTQENHRKSYAFFLTLDPNQVHQMLQSSSQSDMNSYQREAIYW
ncbi:UNVERIFIED_CONTAM: hypothetical protein NCL1_39563 [Trichonephila clavipes]